MLDVGKISEEAKALQEVLKKLYGKVQLNWNVLQLERGEMPVPEGQSLMGWMMQVQTLLLQNTFETILLRELVQSIGETIDPYKDDCIVENWRERVEKEVEGLREKARKIAEEMQKPKLVIAKGSGMPKNPGTPGMS